MKLAVSWFCILHVVFVSGGLFSQSDLKAAHSHLSESRNQSTGSLNNYKHKPLFARRGQYERQRIIVQKPKDVTLPSNELPPPPKVAPKPVKLKCSQLTQSCVLLSGCCDPCASCHCRFFNTICFCRRTNSLCGKAK